MAQTKVMGHCPPDTDSTCSPIAYAWYLKNHKQFDASAYIGGKINKEAAFVLNYFNVETPEMIEAVTEANKLVLIDTNNPEELISGWESAEIIEIVDHHKLYGLKTSSIPTVTVRPYGCVATVLWELMKPAHEALPKEIAGLMAACIISDTLNLTSPTTTDTDRAALSMLSGVAEMNVDVFAAEMFAAKSNLDGLSPREILLTDAKDFKFGESLYKIAVLETTNPEQALSKRNEITAVMNAVKSEESLTGIMFFVVDIVKSHAVLVTSSEEDKSLAEKAFGTTANTEGLIDLPEVVSRKKQIVPAFEKLFS